MKNEGKRYIVCRNEAEAEKDRKDREAIVTALDAQLKKGDKALVGNSAYRRYLRKIGKAKDNRSFEIDAGKLAEGNCSPPGGYVDCTRDAPARVRRIASRAPMERRRAVSMTERMSA